jgi:hypothetical protein
MVLAGPARNSRIRFLLCLCSFGVPLDTLNPIFAPEALLVRKL